MRRSTLSQLVIRADPIAGSATGCLGQGKHLIRLRHPCSAFHHRHANPDESPLPSDGTDDIIEEMRLAIEGILAEHDEGQ
jgi:hypothetical protein